MDLFYTIVLSIATIVLIVLLTYIGIQLSKPSITVPVFPPTYNSCPDFWQVQGNACLIPSSVGKNIGSIYDNKNGMVSLQLNQSNTNGISSDNKGIDFDSPNWGTGKSLICAQQKWANTYGILFDGISNYNGC